MKLPFLTLGKINKKLIKMLDSIFNWFYYVQ